MMNINPLEVLRYLGYNNQNIDGNTQKLLNECMIEINTILKKSSVYNIYDINKEKDTIILKNTNLILKSKDISNHLLQSEKCALMAVSLGLEVDRRILYYSKTNMTKSIILDACASTAIEALCDKVEDEIRKKATVNGYHITSRFSPGYGDLPITLQAQILEVLKAYPKIGLTATKSSILLPRKSVTAFIGWQKEKIIYKNNKCKVCSKQNCVYRKCRDIDE